MIFRGIHKTLGFVFFMTMANYTLWAQDDCNKLGAWLWYIEISGFGTHEKLADSLQMVGVKRIYVKVADGKPNPSVWPELLDREVVEAYRSRGLEVWAWSYNYPGNETDQAKALSLAAETGYEGFVVDVETEFDNKPQALLNLFQAFATERDKVRTVPSKASFNLYITTWGNPGDHKFHFRDIDAYIDGYKPQTYIENWGGIYYTNSAYWIQYGTDEYRMLGATKPVHHIVSTEKGIITPEKINEFFNISGAESSVWVVPGDNTSFSLWDKTWKKINWRMNFCSSSVVESDRRPPSLSIFPNPGNGYCKLITSIPVKSTVVYDISGKIVAYFEGDEIDATRLSAGFYLVKATLQDGTISLGKWVVK
jgi:hypothetical protein